MYKSKEEKINFLASVGIEFKDNPEFTLEEVYNLGLIKELIRDTISCFGTYDTTDKTCETCFLGVRGYCQSLTGFNSAINPITTKESVIIVNTSKTGDKVTFEFLQTQLDKLKLKPNTKTYKIAEVILKGNNKSFGSVIADIMSILGTTSDLKKATVRFYVVRRKIEQTTNLKIDLITQKLVSIRVNND